jgi:hypothetical protein
VSNIQDHLSLVLDAVIVSSLGGWVPSHIIGLAPNRYLLAVGFVDDVVEKFGAVGVGDDLVASDNVLVIII